MAAHGHVQWKEPKTDFPLRPSVAVWCVRFSQEPADQSVVLGERVVLSCVVFNYTGIVQWTKDGLALGIGEGLRGERRIKKCGIRRRKELSASPSCRDQSEARRRSNSDMASVRFRLKEPRQKLIWLKSLEVLQHLENDHRTMQKKC